ncbi:hypothetical protein FEM48_Zijuj07G0058900 [Ziziphus jujuba var. spinosa]|uniref:Receptor ligand binding region domain-containing protein n=1 Tax=Ziziphus jujuba var. spinosa TaxID=714518 RepID=A0A978V2V0_ZIZJJ|nr:hypothetical protein FEM48_Zijuj07G0058900 [Ziziphus jujuba var. spinosa]
MCSSFRISRDELETMVAPMVANMVDCQKNLDLIKKFAHDFVGFCKYVQDHDRNLSAGRSKKEESEEKLDTKPEKRNADDEAAINKYEDKRSAVENAERVQILIAENTALALGTPIDLDKYFTMLDLKCIQSVCGYQHKEVRDILSKNISIRLSVVLTRMKRKRKEVEHSIERLKIDLEMSSSDSNNTIVHHEDEVHVGVIVDMESKEGKIVQNFDLLETIKVEAITGAQTRRGANSLAVLGDKAEVPVISLPEPSSYLCYSGYHFCTPSTQDVETCQFKAITSMVNSFKWRDVILIYWDIDFATDIITYMVDFFHENGVHCAYVRSSCVQTSSQCKRVRNRFCRLLVSERHTQFMIATTMNLLDSVDSSVIGSMLVEDPNIVVRELSAYAFGQMIQLLGKLEGWDIGVIQREAKKKWIGEDVYHLLMILKHPLYGLEDRHPNRGELTGPPQWGLNSSHSNWNWDTFKGNAANYNSMHLLQCFPSSVNYRCDSRDSTLGLISVAAIVRLGIESLTTVRVTGDLSHMIHLKNMRKLYENGSKHGSVSALVDKVP